MTQTVNKPHFQEVLHKQLLGFLLTVTIILSKVLHGFLENIFQTWQKKKKQSPRKGCLIVSKVTKQLGPRRSLPQGPLEAETISSAEPLSCCYSAFVLYTMKLSRHVTTVALFLDDNKTNDNGDGKENGKKIICSY